MKFAYKFSNLIGTVYRSGNLVFTPDGNTVVSPVGNRLSFFDLKNNKSETIPIESRYNFTSVAIAPNGCTLIAINEPGEALLCSLISRTVIHSFHFKRPINCIKFSPNGKYFAVTKDNAVYIYRAPGPASREYNPFVLEKVINISYDETTCIDWSSDSRILVVGSKDTSTKVVTLHKSDNFHMAALGSHSDVIVGGFFVKDSMDLYTVSRNTYLCVWECSHELKDIQLAKDEEGQTNQDDDVREVSESKVHYKRLAKHSFKDALKTDKHVSLLSSDFHRSTNILVTGYSNGAFLLHELPDFNLIHSLSISDYNISSVAFNCTGDWIALASSVKGQLVVWEWQSESFVLKQQGHVNNMACVAYSPDGQYIVTGGEDGKVKLWNTSNGFCFVTFSDHKSAITDVAFTQSGKVVLSASTDGTVRAFDLHRYRNFRTFTSPHPSQFSCLAVDLSGEVVCAGSQDTFEIFVWSVKTGRLLEVLAGHEAPVGGISFSPTRSVLISASWDKSLRIWNMFSDKGARETLVLNSDGLTAQFRPDGQEFAVATLDGNILFFDSQTSVQTGSIEGQKDLSSGRKDADLITAKRLTKTQAFSALCFTADGECILAAGRSKFVCIYHVTEQLLLKKFEISCNRSLDGVNDFINRRKITEFGNMALVEERNDDCDRAIIPLPGVRKGDFSSRSFKPEIRVSSVTFSPTGRSWIAATTEGLLVYSLDQALVFDPFELEQEITPFTIRHQVLNKEYSKAIMMSFKLNEKNLISEVIESVPVDSIELIARHLPLLYIEKLLHFLGGALESVPHIQFYLHWIVNLLKYHGEPLKQRSGSVMSVVRTLQKNVTLRYNELSKLCDHNKYLIKYIRTLNNLLAMKANENMDSQSSDEDQSDTNSDDNDILMSV